MGVYPRLQERIATVDQRAALYADSDAANDPPMLPQTTYQCVLCHQRR